ncbi:hypothetical protein PtB15_3B448 [Puccinia triticina]|nr:hypothetical protein PtB15_3B448 [Puccinia triticina]
MVATGIPCPPASQLPEAPEPAPLVPSTWQPFDGLPDELCEDESVVGDDDLIMSSDASSSKSESTSSDAPLSEYNSDNEADDEEWDLPEAEPTEPTGETPQNGESSQDPLDNEDGAGTRKHRRNEPNIWWPFKSQERYEIIGKASEATPAEADFLQNLENTAKISTKSLFNTFFELAVVSQGCLTRGGLRPRCTVEARLDVAATRDHLSDAATVNHLVPPDTEPLQPWNRIDEFEGESAQVECQQRDRLVSASDVLTASVNDSDPLLCKLAGLARRLLRVAHHAHRHSAHQAGTPPSQQ